MAVRRTSGTIADDGSDPVASARAGGLRYVTDAIPGFRRRRAGRGFMYLDADGGRVNDPETLARIRSLAIPPAWVDVWICPIPNGHLQAVGRDARGRKQYRYHPRWRQVRDEAKYERLIEFARAIPEIRRRVARDLSAEGLPKEKVIATVVRLLDTLWIRIGNPEYARENDSFGLATMLDEHVRIRGAELRFEFQGKGGKAHTLVLEEPRLARIVKRLRSLPGQELFQYLDDEGVQLGIGSDDVNEYLRETTGQDFTSKDFRTWAGTVLCATALRRAGSFRSEREAKRKVTRGVEAVAGQLGNTPAVCRASYIHPDVIDAYLDGSLLSSHASGGARRSRYGLRRDERWVLGLLRRRARRGARRSAA
jgi:DNA topoisomerase I